VNALDKNGLTSLHHAAAEGHKEVVELLIANGADVNAKSVFGTPQVQAIHFKHTETADLTANRAFNR